MYINILHPRSKDVGECRFIHPPLNSFLLQRSFEALELLHLRWSRVGEGRRESGDKGGRERRAGEKGRR